MARQPRYIVPNYPQHIIQRGNNRSIIFHTAGDYYFYLEKLLKASEKHECKIHAYILMTNHIHLLATPLHEESISASIESDPIDFDCRNVDSDVLTCLMPQIAWTNVDT